MKGDSYGDGTIAVFDTTLENQSATYKMVACVDRSVKGCHKRSVDCVQWYPHDSGMFSALSSNCTLKVWDTNELVVACCFRFDNEICNFHMGNCFRHMLISVTCEDRVAYLCDLRTGSKTHSLRGHDGPVLMTKWSPRNKNILVTSSVCGEIYVWDVRKSNSLLIALERSKGCKYAHRGPVNGLSFTSDGLTLISYGNDHSMQTWDLSSQNPLQVVYPTVENKLRHPVQIDVNLMSGVVFLPSNEHIKVVQVHRKQHMNTLTAHMCDVKCCEFNSLTQNLYSGSLDTQILEWSKQS